MQFFASDIPTAPNILYPLNHLQIFFTFNLVLLLPKRYQMDLCLQANSKHCIEDFLKLKQWKEVHYWTICRISQLLTLHLLLSNEFQRRIGCTVDFVRMKRCRMLSLAAKFRKNHCSSTFQICKEADHFLKLQVLRGEFRFDVFYEAICNILDVERLYKKTDFSHNFEHKLYLIRSIVNVYIQI